MENYDPTIGKFWQVDFGAEKIKRNRKYVYLWCITYNMLRMAEKIERRGSVDYPGHIKVNTRYIRFIVADTMFEENGYTWL